MKHVIELIRDFIGDESMNPQHKAELLDRMIKGACYVGGAFALGYILNAVASIIASLG